MTDVETLIKELSEEIVKTADGRYGLALAGSAAKGTFDKNSDIDFFLYIEKAKPFEERERIIKSIADKDKGCYISYDLRDGAWGGSMDFYYKGIPVETTVRFIKDTDNYINSCIDGKFSIIPAVWTTNGYYTYIYLSEASFIKPIVDPYSVIADYNEKAKVYPKKLKESILNEFWAEALCGLTASTMKAQ